jgi:uncharacterized membrane protein YedE/YeeE
MLMAEKLSAIITILRREYQKVFVENWTSLTGGVLIGLMSIVTFAWDHPWGVAGGVRNWGDWFFYGIGLYDTRPVSAILSAKSVIVIGLLWGALAAALIARQFVFRVPNRLELFKGAVGGIFLGVGAALAGGCNVGGFYSSIGAFSLSGFAMMIGLLIGAFIGLKYLYWDLEHLPTVYNVKNKIPFAKETSWDYWQPILGFGMILGAFWANEIYSLHGYIVIGGLFLCGTAFGFIMHRSRFCFSRCFREPFMTGDAAATQAVIISLLICVLGFAVIKWTGLRNELAFTASSFGLGGLVGGFIFGFGMLLTGGCGSGTVWRVAEGQVKLMLALVTFALSTSLTKTLIRSTESIRSVIGWKVFLPDLFGYPLAMFSVFLIMVLWYFTATWNEETEFFVIQV